MRINTIETLAVSSTSAAALVFPLKLHLTFYSISLISEQHQVARCWLWGLHCYEAIRPFSFFKRNPDLLQNYIKAPVLLLVQ